MSEQETVATRLRQVRKSLPENVCLVAVSKFHPSASILEAYNAGQRDFGESRAQELCVKAPALPRDIRWHFIGHLQTNKVKQVVEHADLIQSVDSLRLLRAIDRESGRQGKRTDILLQVHVAAEDTKTGFLPEEIEEAVSEAQSLGNVKLRGIMGMATNTDDEERIRDDFRKLRECLETIQSIDLDSDVNILSMGMSDDRQLAIEEKSNMVRVGTDIFGMREY